METKVSAMSKLEESILLRASVGIGVSSSPNGDKCPIWKVNTVVLENVAIHAPRVTYTISNDWWYTVNNDSSVD